MNHLPPFSLERLMKERLPSRSLLREAKHMAEQDPIMRQALYMETLHAFLANDLELGKRLLRLLVHVSVGFEGLAEMLSLPSKSLLRMLSIKGNPTSKHLFQILACIQKHERMRVHVEVCIPNPTLLQKNKID